MIEDLVETKASEAPGQLSLGQERDFQIWDCCVWHLSSNRSDFAISSSRSRKSLLHYWQVYGAALVEYRNGMHRSRLTKHVILGPPFRQQGLVAHVIMQSKTEILSSSEMLKKPETHPSFSVSIDLAGSPSSVLEFVHPLLPFLP